MNQAPSETESDSNQWDAVFLQSRRELWVILVLWGIFAVWVVGTSWWLGYRGADEEFSMVWGFPSWVFWGVAVPWLAANGAILWFCCGFMKDQELESPADGDADSNQNA